MLDLIISYFNFIVLAIGYIVKKFTFFPPDPPHYKSCPTGIEDEEDILFLIDHKKKIPNYIGIEFRLIDYRFIKLIDKDNNALPLLLFKPPQNIPICIIYSHGNSGDLGSCLIEYYDIAVNTNCIVVSYEYPGYGECKNQPITESEFFRNIKKAYYFVRKILKFKPSHIILYGFSLGTGIALDLACRKEYSAAGLILQSPFLSIVRTLYNIKKTQYFDLFNNCDKAKKLHIKTLFIHGNRDSMVPYVHGRILAKLIPEKYYYDFLTVDNGDHNNVFKLKKEDIYRKIRKFIKDCTDKSSNLNSKKISDLDDALHTTKADTEREKEMKHKIQNNTNEFLKEDKIKKLPNKLTEKNFSKITINPMMNELGQLKKKAGYNKYSLLNKNFKNYNYQDIYAPLSEENFIANSSFTKLNSSK